MNRAAFFVIIGLGGTAILLALGVWQMQRLAWKQGVIADIEGYMAGAPVAIPWRPDDERHRYLPVTATGTLGIEALFVLVSQKNLGAGYRVIAPFETDGRRVLADLGFAPTQIKAKSNHAGPATLTGNLQWPQEVDGFTPAPDLAENIWYARDVPAMAEALDTEPVLLVVRSGNLAEGGITPMPVDTSRIPNNHLQYAITWFSLAAIWLAMSFYFIRRPSRPAES